MRTCCSHLQGASASLRRFTLISPPARLSSRGFLAAHIRVARMRLCCTCRHAEGSRLATLQVPLLNVHAARSDGLPAVLPAELCCGPASACVGMHLHAGCRCDGVPFSIEFSAMVWKLTMQIALQFTECVQVSSCKIDQCMYLHCDEATTVISKFSSAAEKIAASVTRLHVVTCPAGSWEPVGGAGLPGETICAADPGHYLLVVNAIVCMTDIE